MNFRMVLNTIGRIIATEAALLMLPMLVAVIYGEWKPLSALLITAVICAVVGLLSIILSRTKNRSVYAGEGFVSVAFAWVLLSVFGALPFVLSGEIKNFADAVFETVSGFTTTGASILTDVESMSKSLLFWRSFTHWIGGMGVLVLVLAIIPSSSKGSMNMLRAEMPGPVIGKLVPRVRNTAKILYLIYVVLTALEVILLCIGKMPLFESIVHSLGTAGTGGFGVKSNSIAGYSPYCQWVITVFMLIFGVNFNLYYLILLRRIRSALSSTELWVYIGIVLTSVAVITTNILSLYKDSISESLRHAAFQVAAIISTTGYSTTDFDLWPDVSKGVIFILMFIGGCAGSTAGGLKLSRVVLLFKLISREIRKMLHPRSVSKVHLEGRGVGESTLDSVSVYFAFYIICIAVVFFLLCLEPFGLETNLTAAITCFNNVGPGFAKVGPTQNFSIYSDFSTLLLSAAMLLGRLEIFPLIIAFSPSTWSGKHK